MATTDPLFSNRQFSQVRLNGLVIQLEKKIGISSVFSDCLYLELLKVI